MNQDIKTIELAKVYESQGYFQDALDIYTFLDGQETSSSSQAAIKRMEKRIQESDKNNGSDKNSLPGLIEQWLMLLVLRQRLVAFKKIKTQLQ